MFFFVSFCKLVDHDLCYVIFFVLVSGLFIGFPSILSFLMVVSMLHLLYSFWHLMFFSRSCIGHHCNEMLLYTIVGLPKMSFINICNGAPLIFV